MINNLLARMKVTYDNQANLSLSCEPNNETIATVATIDEVPSND